MADQHPVVIKTTEIKKTCVSRHGLSSQHRTGFGNLTVRHDQNHWHCEEVILRQQDDMAHKLRMDTRDDSGNITECLILVENEYHRNKECLDDLFTQLNIRLWQFVNSVAC